MISLAPSLSIPIPKSPVATFSNQPFIFAVVQQPDSVIRKSISTAKANKTISPVPSLSPLTHNTRTLIPPKKVLVPVGYGTEEMEAVIVVDALRRSGAEVTVASVEQQVEVEAFGGTRLIADTLISSCSDKIFDLVALPGGMPGSARLRDCEILQKITKKQAEEKRLYAAICAAPAVTLLPWGLLRRKQTTGHPAFMDKLPTFWAVKSNIQVSGELTTSQGPGTSFEFSISLVEQLFGESIAKEIGELLLMHVAQDNLRKTEVNEVQWSLDHAPRVLVPIANGCTEIEVVIIVDVLRRAKVDVVIASVERSAKVVASQGVKFIADKLINAAAESTYDLIILPGGIAGTERLCKSRILKKLLKEQALGGRMLGAIGSSPVVLQRHGLLEDKKVTGHPSVISKFNNVVDSAQVVIDGKLITSKGLATATEFALAIVGKLFGHARARSVAEGLVFEFPRS